MVGYKGVTLYALLAITLARCGNAEEEEFLDREQIAFDSTLDDDSAVSPSLTLDRHNKHVKGEGMLDLGRADHDDIHRRNAKHNRGSQTFPPGLYEDGGYLENMLHNAKGVRYYVGTCPNADKDYIIAVEDSRSIEESYWKNEVRSFVKILSYALSVTKGTKSLSLVRYASTTEKILERSLINRNNAMMVGKVIDQMFEQRSSASVAYPGHALKFMRQHVYPKSHSFLDMNDTTQLLVENSAGKDTVVIMISSGSVGDSMLALEEALYSRRNGVIIYALEIGGSRAGFWKHLTGCHIGHRCLKYIPVMKSELLDNVGTLLRSLCVPEGRDAVCKEEWSDYTSCSKPCGTGVMTSTLMNYKTLLKATDGKDPYKGRTCDQQLGNIRTKQLLCNTMACSSSSHPLLSSRHNSKIDGIPEGASITVSAYQDGNGDVVYTAMEDTIDEESDDEEVISKITPSQTKLENSMSLNVDSYPRSKGKEYQYNGEELLEDLAGNIMDESIQHVDGTDTDSYTEPEYLDKHGNLIPDMYIPLNNEIPVDREEHQEQSVMNKREKEHPRKVLRGNSEKPKSFYMKNMYTICAATGVLSLLGVGGASLLLFRPKKKNDDIENAASDNEFLQGNTGGESENAEKEHLAGTDDAVWA